MKRLSHILYFEGKTYNELNDNPNGRIHIEKVFFALMLLEKEICEHSEAKITIDACGVVRMYGIPEALQQKISDALDNAVMKRYWRWVNY